MELPRALDHLAEVHTELIEDLAAIGDRHRPEADVFHTCHQLVERLVPLGAELASHAERYGEAVARPHAETAWSDILARMRRRMAGVAGSSPKAGLLLLWDLRHLYLQAQEDLLGWIMVGQAAKARRDNELRALTDRGYEESERVVKWITTEVKQASAQALAAG
jgi:hypothetical protein